MKEQHSSTTITRIEQQKRRKQRYNIYINDEYAFSIHEDVLIKHQLAKGQAIDSERLESIAQDDEKQQAYHTALRFLSHVARSSKELERKLLEKQFEQEIVDDVIQRLIKQRYIDDEQFATMLTQQRITHQKRGKLWVKRELESKGLSEEHVEGAMSQIDEQTEREHAYSIAKKRWERLKREQMLTKKRRVNDFLLRRGYSYGIVYDVLRELEANDANDANDVDDSQYNDEYPYD